MSFYLTVENLPANEIRVLIREIRKGKYGKELVFDNDQKLVLNVVNDRILQAAFGEQEKAWVGEPILIKIGQASKGYPVLRVSSECGRKVVNNPHTYAETATKSELKNPHAHADESAEKPPVAKKNRPGKSAFAADIEQEIQDGKPLNEVLRRIAEELEFQTQRSENQTAMFNSLASAASQNTRRIEQALSDLSKTRTQFELAMDRLDRECSRARAANGLLVEEIRKARELIARYADITQNHAMLGEFQPVTWQVPEAHLPELAKHLSNATAATAEDVELLFRMSCRLPIPMRLMKLMESEELHKSIANA